MSWKSSTGPSAWPPIGPSDPSGSATPQGSALPGSSWAPRDDGRNPPYRAPFVSARGDADGYTAQQITPRDLAEGAMFDRSRRITATGPARPPYETGDTGPRDVYYPSSKAGIGSDYQSGGQPDAPYPPSGAAGGVGGPSGPPRLWETGDRQSDWSSYQPSSGVIAAEAGEDSDDGEPPKRKSRKLGFILAILLIVIALLIGGYLLRGYILDNKDKPTETPPATPTASATTSAAPTTATTTNTTTTSAAPEATPTNAVAAVDLQVGYCFIKPLVQVVVQTVPVLECTEPHNAEIIFRYDMTDQEVPTYDQTTIEAIAQTQCPTAAESYIGPNYQTLGITLGYYNPSLENWNNGQRWLLCFAQTQDGQLTLNSSLKGMGQ